MSALVDLASPPNPRKRRARARRETLARLRRVRRRRGSAPSPVAFAPVGVPTGLGCGAVQCRRPLGGGSFDGATHPGQPLTVRMQSKRSATRVRPRRPRSSAPSADDRQVLNAFLAQLTRQANALPRRAGGNRDRRWAKRTSCARRRCKPCPMTSDATRIDQRRRCPSLRQPDVEWSGTRRASHSSCASIEDAVQTRLNAPVGNLLDTEPDPGRRHRTAVAARPLDGGRARCA